MRPRDRAAAPFALNIAACEGAIRAAGVRTIVIVPPPARCYRLVMPIEWTISHGSRLVVAVAKGEMWPEHMRDFLQAIDQAGARPYAKMIDVKGLTTSFDP